MSNLTFEEQLRESVVDLHEQLEEDQNLWAELPAQRAGPPTITDNHLLQHYAPMYVKYLQIFRKLESTYDQILQPQKRADVRNILDATIGRMLEVKKRLVRFCGDFINFDDVLVDLKLTPDSLEIPIPRYFTEERQKEIEDREKMFAKLRTSCCGHPGGKADVPPSWARLEEDQKPLTDVDAITILQCNERGRQGRLRAKFMREIKETEERERRVLAEGQIETDPQDCATKIQKHFKGYLARKQVRELHRQELEFLGMEESAALRDALQAERDQLDKCLLKRKMTQQQNQQTLIADRTKMREEIKDQEGGQIMEEIHDQLLEKIIQLKTLDDNREKEDKKDLRWTEFPSVEDGGSLDPTWPWMETKIKKTPAEEQRAADNPGKGKKADDGKKGKGKGKKDAGKKGKKKGGDDDDHTVEEEPPSKFWPRLHENTDRYVSVWQDKFEATDFLQKYDTELLRADIMDGDGGLAEELRKHIDALVRIEIENLKLGLGLKGKGKGKGKKAKGKKGDKKKGKKGKEKGGGAGEEQGEQSVFVDCHKIHHCGGIPRVPKVRVNEYLGAHNLLGKIEEEAGLVQSSQVDEIQRSWEELLSEWEKAEGDKGDDRARLIQKQIGMTLDDFKKLYREWQSGNPSGDPGRDLFEPSMSQVRQAVTEYCVLPLGSQTIYDLVDDPPVKEPDTGGKKKKNQGPLNGMTVLFYGAAGSGKTMMSHAVANETGAIFFDLTPSGPLFFDKTPDKAPTLAKGYISIGQKAVQNLLETVFRVAAAWPPAMIYIDQCDLLFQKKGKKRDKKKDKGAADAEVLKVVGWMKKPLVAELRKLQPTDRVMVLGNMRVTESYDVKTKAGTQQHQELLGFFKTMLYFPHPDYSSRLLLWQQLLRKVGGPEARLPSDHDAEILAYMTNKCTSGTIAQAVRATLTAGRVRRLGQRKLQAEEFLVPLAAYKPIFKDEWERMRDFTVGIRGGYLGIPFGRPGRRRLPRDGIDDDGDEDPKGKKGKKKKKK
eukprot:TRINITY_DN55868_c0_g1_i1.p1 TRINITY_DN55868_c0_g1~~TRINITY_DN55868_c0_g1_i1.p1  ORF type:complete len:1031 (+),score=455.52 TRINITY_DN55868_c0_g1_i1:94-3093(+)